MIYRQNLHTHNHYCDGRGTLEEFVLAAIDFGLDTLGFSSHAYQYFSPVYTISEENTVKYKAEIAELKNKYEGKIRLLAGLEVDMLARPDVSGLDYTIGSSHFMKLGDDFVEFDKKHEIFTDILNKYFDGNIWAFLEKYYDEFSKLSSHGNFDIVGHFDLVCRHCESDKPFFDRLDKRHLDYAFEAVHTIAKDIKIFEVNVGCFAYGTRNTPYPMPEIIKEIKTVGASVIITNDAHDPTKLTGGLDRGIEIIRSCGFNEVMIMTDCGFEGMKI
nr:histidinol-phosphatase HisJ family protein [Clostridia bacterium]